MNTGRRKNFIKNTVKKIPPFYLISRSYKSILSKRHYLSLRRYYEKTAAGKGISYDETKVTAWICGIAAESGIRIRPVQRGALRMIYVGADMEQDYGGIIQGLQRFGEVIPFKKITGEYGQGTVKDDGKNRALSNGRRLLEMIDEALKSSPIHCIIGQMWARTMEPSVLKTIRRTGIPVINISMDDRHSFRGEKVAGGWNGTAGLINGGIDLACTAAAECCMWYQVEGCPAIYLPEASDPEIYKPVTAKKEYDICFVGRNYGIREKIIKMIEKSGARMACYGDGWPDGKISTEEAAELFGKSLMVLGIGTVGHCTDFYSLKQRDFDGPMSGSLYITHDNPDLHELYDIGKEIVTYRTPEECVDKVLYYRGHPDVAQGIGACGRQRAMRDHTWEKRFTRVFNVAGLIRQDNDK